MFETIFVLIGTFVGAGFASGKEVFNFFTIYSFDGLISIFIFSILLFCLIYKCLNIKTKLKLKNYNDFIFYLEKKYIFFNHKFFLLIINIFLASSFYIMVSALSSLFNYQFNIAKITTILGCIFICFFVFYKKNINFICIINSILMPTLILFVFSLCTFNINFNNININLKELNNSNIFLSIFMGLLYFSYNSLLLIPIIFDLKTPKKNNNFKISFIFSLIIFLITFLINLLLLSFYNFIYNLELPILYIANSSIKLFSYFYFFIILSAIFTTLISSGYSFTSNFNNNSNNFKIKLIIFLLFSFIFCLFSFSDLINFFYPIFGLIGFIQIFLILSDKS